MREHRLTMAANAQTKHRIAVLIPCYNEELTISDVVKQFRVELPGSEIYVFDNNSTDATAEMAHEAGAIVLYERRQGKGYVVQSMFRQVDADIYIMVDGDGTYPSAAVRTLLAPILNNDADMVVGSRFTAQSNGKFRRINRLGNRIVLFVLNSIFRVRLTDILSGYRAFNRKFVKNIPLFGGGFEIETELTIKAVERGYRIVEVPIDIGQRPEGSFSKINLIRDGFLILNTILALFRDYQPLTFFGIIGLILICTGILSAFVAVVASFAGYLLPTLPFVVLAVVFIMVGMLSLTVGIILHSIARRSQELEYQLQVMADELSVTGARSDNKQTTKTA